MLHFYYTLLAKLEQLMLPCLFKSLLGIECPGCGLQRSLFLLARGRVLESISLYWATLPILGMLLFCLLHLKFQFKYGNRILIFLYSCNGLIIFCHYFYKLTNHN